MGELVDLVFSPIPGRMPKTDPDWGGGLRIVKKSRSTCWKSKIKIYNQKKMMFFLMEIGLNFGHGDVGCPKITKVVVFLLPPLQH